MELFVLVFISSTFGISIFLLKPKWTGWAFLFLVCVGIVVCSWPYVDWSCGIFREIGMIATEGTLYYWLPSLVVMGVPFLCGRYGYPWLEKKIKKDHK